MKTLLAPLVVLLASLSHSAWAASPCGLSGTIEQRIADCNQSTGVDGEFELVVRTKKGAEIYKGYRTGVIWSADLPGPNHFNDDEVEGICQKKHSEFGGLDHLDWKLPPAERYIQALKYGIQTSLPEMSERDYWTSTADPFYVNSRYIFEGSKKYRERADGTYIFRHLETEIGSAYVKCIAETL